ncbi:hypothetical protein DTO013E5_1459 [Penicillium roqueforti]|uniref:Genomic scaffold, ProqFM164S03 n=1 Tax=Penicillium roqueforti (strain FM164) TaxID=1365484 RepID=W6QB42_PENRF|nr:uncharacterized protein LCP9604111_4988 [Penicillium roqueforti]CDM33685.1 unnamed protein product [Penicillium roqueforti FM164]KAF9248749.1 hypothetical protein LCP9604111_4988 [Penicillium roqueforti]KAI2681696.1 hypothetical protein CBS147355_2906 [Penicillium roqueforti]KAI2689086.1 hypothetical protein LCP963914a_2175 [Penicillium roqueforti]KAI2703858.1 hypothetical protein CBS147372_2327 [Penicillium roqueforti]
MSRMPLPDLDQDITPIPRSREENQERAFIAASRRKDRSLDARLESANRASMLHKKRTGKAFHITKDIVEKEAMYEEVDERYQEKRILMLQRQNEQIEEQFKNHLLAAFAARAQFNNSSIHSRRASHMTPRPSLNGVNGGPRKMSLDLSNIRSSFSQGPGSMASPMPTGDGYVLSPTASYDPSAQSYMASMSGSQTPYSDMFSAPTGNQSGQMPAYMSQQASAPGWNSQVPAWAPMQQQNPTPAQTPTDAQAVQMWQQQMMQQAQMPDTATQMHQFRDRLASAPELPLQHTAPPIPSASISGPTGHHPTHGHSRGQSHPSNNLHKLNLLTQTTNLSHSQVAPSSLSSPRIEALPAGTQSTPDFCPTPNTPLSPTAHATMSPGAKFNSDGIMVSHEEMDPDFTDFSQFAFHLGNSNVPLSDRDQPFAFDDLLALDDFTSVSC